jgi:hypothetical protein
LNVRGGGKGDLGGSTFIGSDDTAVWFPDSTSLPKSLAVSSTSSCGTSSIHTGTTIIPKDNPFSICTFVKFNIMWLYNAVISPIKEQEGFLSFSEANVLAFKQFVSKSHVMLLWDLCPSFAAVFTKWEKEGFWLW